MKYRTLKTKIMKTVASDMTDTMKYVQLRKLFIKMFRQKTPTANFTNKEKVERALFALKKIYFDEETPILFKQFMPNSEMMNTADFIKFLEKIVDEKE